MKKRICVDGRMAFHAGIGTYIRNILPYLKDSDLSLQVLAPLSHVDKWPELNRYDWISIKSPIYSIQEQIELPLKIPSCDVFWSPHYNVPLVPIRAKSRLATIHDVYHLEFSAHLSWMKRSYAKLMLQQAVSRSDHVITISNFSKTELKKWTSINEARVTTVHLGVNATEFVPTSKDEVCQRVKNLYQLPEKYILFVGTHAVHKNLARLLEAWVHVQSKHNNYKLVLVGKNNQPRMYHDALEKNEILKNSVLLLGNVEQSHLPIIYQGAQGFILPSLYEGFGLPPLEAMTMKCPTIVSKAASLPEVCGEASLYVDPYDPSDISKKICELIESPALRQTLIDKGLERIKHFSWEKTAQAHLEIIQRLAS